MKRRDFLEKLKDAALAIFCGHFLGGCEFIERSVYRPTHMAYCLAYLLYGDNPPDAEVVKFQNLLHSAVRNDPGLQSVLERIYFDIRLKSWPVSFENISAERRRDIMNTMLPVLLEHSNIIDVIDHYLDEGKALKVLDYPELSGSFGECGWLILEGEIWDRYYGK